jgi:hypothetical protein
MGACILAAVMFPLVWLPYTLMTMPASSVGPQVSALFAKRSISMCREEDTPALGSAELLLLLLLPAPRGLTAQFNSGSGQASSVVD